MSIASYRNLRLLLHPSSARWHTDRLGVALRIPWIRVKPDCVEPEGRATINMSHPPLYGIFMAQTARGKYNRRDSIPVQRFIMYLNDDITESWPFGRSCTGHIFRRSNSHSEVVTAARQVTGEWLRYQDLIAP